MTDHRSLEWAIDIIGMCEPIRCVQGGMWFNRNQEFADATFVDYGAADAFAVAAKALPSLVKTLQAMVQAIDAGAVKIDSPNIGGGDPEIGYEQHYWIDEWLHHARSALSALPQAQCNKP